MRTVGRYGHLHGLNLDVGITTFSWMLTIFIDCVPASTMFRIWVRAASRSIPPPWWSIRFRLAPRTYDAPPWGCIVRVVSQTKSRKIPTRRMLPPFFVTKDVFLYEGSKVIFRIGQHKQSGNIFSGGCFS